MLVLKASCGILLSSALLAAFGAGAAHAAESSYVDLRRTQPASGNVAAGEQASTVCAACHGANGIAVVPNFPSLASQPSGYLAVQLHGFAEGWREDPVMQGQAATLSEDDIANLAAFYAAQASPAAGEPNRESAGAALFHEGDPARGIPPCQGCHGVAARGPQPDLADTAPESPWQTWPSLAGLPADYVAKRLKEFQGDAGLATSNTRIMHGVTSNLTPDDMAAIATYISTL